jgi:lipoprotein-releasing system ATP-binding protein
MSDSLLRVENLDKSFRSGSRELRVLRELEFDVSEGEAVAIVGDSGVGKSTLLHILGGMDRPDGGRVLFRGRDIYGLSPAELAVHRYRNVGFIFQFHHLLPELTAIENVEMPFHIGRRPERATEEALRILEQLGMADRLNHVPGELSGGEQQRVAIARALVAGPSLVLADEPTGNLDPHTGGDVFRLLRGLQGQIRFALVLASHSERLARGCDRLLRLDDGGLRRMEERETQEYFDRFGV